MADINAQTVELLQRLGTGEPVTIRYPETYHLASLIRWAMEYKREEYQSNAATPPEIAGLADRLEDLESEAEPYMASQINAAIGVLRSISTPPADAALADALCESLIESSDMRWNGDVYIGDGADLMNLVRAALRARAVPEGCNHENRTSNYDHLSCNSCGAFMTDSQWGAASNKWFPSKAAAMLAASKAAEGKV